MATNWDAAKPAGGTKVRLSDEELRSNFAAIQSCVGLEHEFPVGEATDGLHKLITFSGQQADPTPGANKGAIYISDIAAKAELMWQDEQGSSMQLTSLGYPQGFPSGTKMLFYQDAAPGGWTLDNTLDDKLLFVTKGSGSGGAAGGAALAGSTWTQPNHAHNHTHTGPDHFHAISGVGWNAGTDELCFREADLDLAGTFTETRQISTDAGVNAGVPQFKTGLGGTGNTGADATVGATANTWRPASYCAIICAKD